jgi:hypothetical protein
MQLHHRRNDEKEIANLSCFKSSARVIMKKVEFLIHTVKPGGAVVKHGGLWSR